MDQPEQAAQHDLQPGEEDAGEARVAVVRHAIDRCAR
jgi:hypothetical protein